MNKKAQKTKENIRKQRHNKNRLNQKNCIINYVS